MEKIHINALVNAGIDKVWKYYNHPEHIVHWNFASDDWMCPKAESELKPGGKYLARMEAKDGSFGFDFEAIFDTVKEPETVAYTMLDGRQAVVSFQALDGKTQVDIHFDPEQTNPLEMQKQGWQAILNNFKKYTEAN